jgi:hypothetical protein
MIRILFLFSENITPRFVAAFSGSHSKVTAMVESSASSERPPPKSDDRGFHRNWLAAAPFVRRLLVRVAATQ